MTVPSGTRGSPTSGPPAGGADRHHALDALRGFALLLGVLFHAAESFEPGIQSWAIADVSPSRVLDVLRHASHSFRMELFFLIAGFFARLLVERRGVGEFLKNRVLRILLPLAVGWIVLYPLMVSLWALGAQVSGNWQALPLPVEARGLPAWKVGFGQLISGGFVENFNLLHLWFLHQLLVIYALVLGTRWALLRWASSGTIEIILRRADQFVARAAGSGWRLPVLALLTWPVLLRMDDWVDTPNESVVPVLPTTLLYGGFFLAGWFLHRQPQLLEVLARRPWPALGAAVVLMVLTRLLHPVADEWGLLPRHAGLVRGVARGLYAAMMWGFVLGVMGVFLRCFGRPSAAWRYTADASYWIYLAHLPVVVSLQIWVGRWEQPWWAKYPLVVGIAMVLLFASYHLLVRSTPVGGLLNGRRHPFRLRSKAD